MSTCANCGSEDLVRIALTPAGKPLQFATCRRCEHRWWTDAAAGETVGLADVLEHVAPS